MVSSVTISVIVGSSSTTSTIGAGGIIIGAGVGVGPGNVVVPLLADGVAEDVAVSKVTNE